MFKNYIKTALRSLVKHKEYAFINILGLAIGMASVILILLFVQEELSYDQFHTNRDSIYRLNIKTTHPHTGATAERAIGPFRLAKELKVDFSDIPHIVRFYPQGRTLIQLGDERFYEERVAFVDPDVFQVFDLPLLTGDAKTVLDHPYSIVVSQEIAQKYFGDE